ncbi:MAG: DUF1700 domain-containing protein [Oscillospiraceae bacterium]|nr:DUF1700 domain-containing protein [Oscillospiraceae bacterium]
MTREEFMSRLRRQLEGFSSAETARVLEYYEELFSDSLEAGKTEQEIIAGLDTPEVIAERVRVELAFLRAEQEPSAKNFNTALLVILGVFALPIGLPLGFAVLVVLFAAGMVGVSLVVAALATLAALGVSGIGLIITGFVSLVSGVPLLGFALIGSGLICAGLGLLTGVGGWALVRALFRVCAKLFRKIYMSIMKKRKKEAAV